ncbi:hypothetical protein [Petroclostridium xylanilyticum]|nr:hypothetical protein [Petroclostridium xylanilyticum]
MTRKEKRQLSTESKAFRCHKVQGYYFSKPLPYEEVLKFLREH